jgi:hypothetical protein
VVLILMLVLVLVLVLVMLLRPFPGMMMEQSCDPAGVHQCE